jgi:alkanesulfonate monooxygenase
MPVEFIGYIGTQHQSEIHPGPRPGDRSRLCRARRPPAASTAPWSRSAPPGPESQLVVAHAASVTKTLGFMIAHRPGFTAPTLAARQLATLDQFTGGRVAVHIITGGSDEELAKDGDHLTKDERYARTSEYLDIVRAGMDQRQAVRLRRASTTRSSRASAR